MIGKLEELRLRTEQVKEHKKTADITKEAVIQRLVKMLSRSKAEKTVKHAGNRGTSAEMTRQKEEKRKKADIIKEGIATQTGGRPGQGITAMGTGMAPYQFMAQPQVAQQSVEIAGRNLRTAWPGLTAAAKSTSPMKRNQGSIKASVKRQNPTAAKGELLSRSAALQQKDPAQLIDQGGQMKAASVSLVVMNQQAASALAGNSDMEKVAIGGLIRFGGAAWKALRRGGGLRRAISSGGAARTHGTRATRAARRARQARSAHDASYLPRGREAAEALSGAGHSANTLAHIRRTGRLPDVVRNIPAVPARTSRLLDAAGNPITTAATAARTVTTRGAKVPGLVRTSTGATTVAKTNPAATAGRLGRAGHRMKETLKGARHRLFGAGTGMRNVYKTKDGVEFLGSRTGGLANLVPFGRSILRPGNTKRGVELVKRWDETGGIVPRMLKGMGRGGTRGGLFGYGASYAANREADWNDPMRMNMALGGALLGTTFHGGKLLSPASIGGTGLNIAADQGLLGDRARNAAWGKGLADARPLYERQQIHNRQRYGTSAMRALRGHQGTQHRRRNADRLERQGAGNTAAQANWEALQRQRADNLNQIGAGRQTRLTR